MSGARPRLSQVPLWERHVELVLAITRDALHLLAARGITQGQTELTLNRALYECLLEANRARHDGGHPYLDLQIMWETRNQPSPTTAGTTAERKIPDFQCGYIDHLCPDPLLSAKSFVIECKRLGLASRAGWDFNSRYVSDGVVRFVDMRWQYGKHVDSGAMIGYLDGTHVADVLTEVNAAATSHTLPVLQQMTGSSAPLHELEHSLMRSFPESPFHLLHLWIEDPTPTAKPPKPSGTVPAHA